MAFKRALWHSGLKYKHVCERCRTAVVYTDYNLDFRPWYADGFVYCPNCKTPLRHNERLAINEDGTPYVPPTETGQVDMTSPSPAGAFCTACGSPVSVADNFCQNCGNRLK